MTDMHCEYDPEICANADGYAYERGAHDHDYDPADESTTCTTEFDNTV